jgi:HlyD family secretion protein
MKKILIALLVAAAVAGGVYYFFARKQARSSTESSEATTAKVERGSIQQAIAATGRVIANLDVDIKCKASGDVVNLPFDVSDPIKKDDLLLELDPVDEQRAVSLADVTLNASQARLEQAKLNLTIQERTLTTDRARAESSLKSAEARFKDARAKADRFQDLLGKKLASQEEYETAETAAIQANADLEAARVRLDELRTAELALEVRRQDVRLAETQVDKDKIALSDVQQRLKDTKVTAPMDGVIAARNVQIGQIIASGISNVGGGTTVLTLSDLSRIFVLAAVDESDIGNVTLGQQVVVTADAFPGKVFSGRVVRIATQGVNISNVVTFEVKIEVTGEYKSLLKPEMTANVEIIIARKDNVLLVPSEAVTRKAPRHIALVMKSDKTQEERPVEIGISDGTKTEIVSGLSEGETVVFHKGEAESRWRQEQGGPPSPMMMMGRPR